MFDKERYLRFQPKTIEEGDIDRADTDFTVSLAESGVVMRNDGTKPDMSLVLKSLEKMRLKRRENKEYSHFLSIEK